MRIRQIVLAAERLEPLVTDLCSVMGTEVAFRDPAVREFGLENAVLPLGDQFLEVVAPVVSDAPVRRFLARRPAGGGYMLILQCDDLERHEARFAALGIRVVWKIDLPEIRARHLHPKDVGGTLLSLDEPREPSEWPWAGPQWRQVRQQGIVSRIVAAEISSVDPELLSRRWSDLLERPERSAGAQRREIPLDGGLLRFVPAIGGRGEELAGFDLAVADANSLLARARARGFPTESSGFFVGATRFGVA
jgi:hypothetical protein